MDCAEAFVRDPAIIDLARAVAVVRYCSTVEGKMVGESGAAMERVVE